MKLVLLGEPKSTQKLYGLSCRGRFPQRFMTREAKDIKTAYEWEARSQWKGKPLIGPVSVDITLFFGTKRKTDLDNFHKISLDALSGVVYEDDGQIDELKVRRAFDKQQPRIELVIEPYSYPHHPLEPSS